MSSVTLEIKGHCAVMTLNEAHKRNVLNQDMCEEMISFTRQIESDENIKALVVTGAGKAFCAGADLGDLLAAGAGEGAGLKRIYSGFLAVAECRLPTIAAVNGPAVGAGMNLALACDVRIAAESARFDTRFLKIGIHPGGGHTWMLHREMGWQAATAQVLFGKTLSGRQAEARGLAWECVADDGLMDASLAFADGLADTARELLIRTKSSMQKTRWIEMQEQALEVEYEQQVWSIRQESAAQALQAMFDKIQEAKG